MSVMFCVGLLRLGDRKIGSYLVRPAGCISAKTAGGAVKKVE